jgi:dTDP-4-amino-4,6-dideoxygalactose transaminase
MTTVSSTLSQKDRMSEKLALLGGPKAVTLEPKDMFTWPIVTKEDEKAVLEVLRAGRMSHSDISRLFEQEYAAWQGVKYGLSHVNGSEALQTAMYAAGVRRGDEVICPSMTYWASGTVAYTLGATVVWADIQPDTLCVDPKSIEKLISDRTKLIVAVHYAGMPADMDEIMAIARKHGIKVLEDVSHAHGGMYKGKMLGSIGDIAAMSMMSFKSFAIGEGGMLLTNDRFMYEMAIAWSHYDRTGRFSQDLTLEQPLKYAGMPLGAVKGRLNQMSAAMGRVQLKYYPKRNAEILKAMNYFWDKVGKVKGVKPHRPAKDSGKVIGGWYSAHGLYDAKELGGLPVARFCEALRAEGFDAQPGANAPIHLHPMVNEADIYGDGMPTALANASTLPNGQKKDVRAKQGSLPVAEAIMDICFSVPWFKKHRPKVIAEYALALKKVLAHVDELR